MDNPFKILGIALIVLGLASLLYEGITYVQEPVAKLGPLEIDQTKQETVKFPPYVGGIALAAGLLIVVIGRRK